jgi:hypothetical protein
MLGNPDISGKNQPENRSPGDFPWSVYRLVIVQTKLCRLSVEKETKRSYPCTWTKWTCPSMPGGRHVQPNSRFFMSTGCKTVGVGLNAPDQVALSVLHAVSFVVKVATCSGPIEWDNDETETTFLFFY